MAKKVLVVEDDRFLRELYNELLTDENYEVSIAEDGEAGFSQAQQGGFDLVLLDIMLPKMDGLEVLKRLKESPPKTKNGPVVLLTNLGQDSIIKQGFELGASGYLIKSSMNPDQVLSEIKVFLDKSSTSK